MKCPTKTIKHDYNNNANQQLDVYVNYIQEFTKRVGECEWEGGKWSDRDSYNHICISREHNENDGRKGGWEIHQQSLCQ